MYFRPISPQLLRRNFGRFAGHVAAGAGGRRRLKHTNEHVNCRHGKCCIRRPPRSPRTRAPKVSRLASSLSARHLGAAFRATSGQRTRGRRPNPRSRKLLNVLLKLVCEGRALEAAAGSSVIRAAEAIFRTSLTCLFEHKTRRGTLEGVSIEYEVAESPAGRKRSAPRERT